MRVSCFVYSDIESNSQSSTNHIPDPCANPQELLPGHRSHDGLRDPPPSLQPRKPYCPKKSGGAQTAVAVRYLLLKRKGAPVPASVDPIAIALNRIRRKNDAGQDFACIPPFGGRCA